MNKKKAQEVLGRFEEKVDKYSQRLRDGDPEVSELKEMQRDYTESAVELNKCLDEPEVREANQRMVIDDLMRKSDFNYDESRLNDPRLTEPFPQEVEVKVSQPSKPAKAEPKKSKVLQEIGNIFVSLAILTGIGLGGVYAYNNWINPSARTMLQRHGMPMPKEASSKADGGALVPNPGNENSGSFATKDAETYSRLINGATVFYEGNDGFGYVRPNTGRSKVVVHKSHLDYLQLALAFKAKNRGLMLTDEEIKADLRDMSGSDWLVTDQEIMGYMGRVARAEGATYPKGTMKYITVLKRFCDLYPDREKGYTLGGQKIDERFHYDAIKSLAMKCAITGRMLDSQERFNEFWEMGDVIEGITPESILAYRRNLR